MPSPICNVDSAASGPNLSVSAVPSISCWMTSRASSTVSIDCLSVRRRGLPVTAIAACAAHAGDVIDNWLGSGSDYTVSANFLGVPEARRHLVSNMCSITWVYEHAQLGRCSVIPDSVHIQFLGQSRGGGRRCGAARLRNLYAQRRRTSPPTPKGSGCSAAPSTPWRRRADEPVPRRRASKCAAPGRATKCSFLRTYPPVGFSRGLARFSSHGLPGCPRIYLIHAPKNCLWRDRCFRVSRKL